MCDWSYNVAGRYTTISATTPLFLLEVKCHWVSACDKFLKLVSTTFQEVRLGHWCLMLSARIWLNLVAAIGHWGQRDQMTIKSCEFMSHRGILNWFYGLSGKCTSFRKVMLFLFEVKDHHGITMWCIWNPWAKPCTYLKIVAMFVMFLIYVLC